MSIVDPTSFGFAKVFSYLLLTERYSSKKKPAENCKEYESRILRDHYGRFLSQFEIIEKSSMTQSLNEFFETLSKIFKPWVKSIREKKRSILATFSSDNWDKLNEKKSSHSLFDCQGCLRSANLRNVLSMFKSVSNSHKLKAKKNGLVDPMALKDRTIEQQIY